MPQQAGADHSRLDGFRGELYDCFTARCDALFELVDGLCQPIPVEGVAHLTLAAGAQRGHGSAYAALDKGRIDEDLLRDVLAAHRPAGWGTTFAIDSSVWARPDANRSPGRGFYRQAHAKARIVKGQPIVAGWNFSLLAALSPDSSLWTAPLDIRAHTAGDNATTIAATQILDLLPRLMTADPDGGRPDPAPLFVLDAAYQPAQLTRDLTGTTAQIAVRIRNDRVFFTRAAPRHPGKPGRPQRHGRRMHCAHPASHPTPDDSTTLHTKQFGRIQVHAWHHLHPERPGLRDELNRPAIIECSVIRITTRRLPAGRRHPQPIWLWWAGPTGTNPNLAHITTAYLHRFDIEHTFRFTKQTLGLTTPKIRTPEQGLRWAWLVITAYNQLRLAVPAITDHRLPWQPPQPADKTTPGRARQGFAHLAPTLNRPTNPPKTRTPGPGRPKGRKSTPAPHYPALKTPPRQPTKSVGKG
jgi:hypothetical protein